MNLMFDKKCKLQNKFWDLENFEYIEYIPRNINIQESLVEFDQWYTRLQKHQFAIMDGLLRSKLLKASNIS